MGFSLDWVGWRFLGGHRDDCGGVVYHHSHIARVTPLDRNTINHLPAIIDTKTSKIIVYVNGDGRNPMVSI